MAAWMKQPLRKAFNSILSAVDESREKKEKLKRVAKLMQNVKNKWRDICFEEWKAVKAQVGDRVAPLPPPHPPPPLHPHPPPPSPPPSPP